jgi:hypothetical protein
MSLSCHQCRQSIVGYPHYYYRDSRQHETDKVPFCSTLCIQSWKGSGGYRHYNIINFDQIIQRRRENQDPNDGDVRT